MYLNEEELEKSLTAIKAILRLIHKNENTTLLCSERAPDPEYLQNLLTDLEYELEDLSDAQGKIENLITHTRHAVSKLDEFLRSADKNEEQNFTWDN